MLVTIHFRERLIPSFLSCATPRRVLLFFLTGMRHVSALTEGRGGGGEMNEGVGGGCF